MSDHLADIDLPLSHAIGVWHDLETALAGKSGYGGDVVEIYAYRLMSDRLRRATDPRVATESSAGETLALKAEAARAAGKNLTQILRHFTDLHPGVVFAYDERGCHRPINLASEEIPPFEWRIHLQVTQIRNGARAPSIHELREALAATVRNADVLTAMLDELSDRRAAKGSENE